MTKSLQDFENPAASPNGSVLSTYSWARRALCHVALVGAGRPRSQPARNLGAVPGERGTDPRGPRAPAGGGSWGSPSHFSNLSTRGPQPSSRRNALFPPPSATKIEKAREARQRASLQSVCMGGSEGAPLRDQGGPQQSPLRLISDPLAISTDTNENCLAPGAVPSKSRLEPPPQRPPDPCSAPSPGPSCRRLPPLAFLLLLTPHPVAQLRPRSTSFSARRHLQITLGTSPRPAAPCRPLRTPGRLTRRRRGGGAPFPAAAPAAREPAEPTVGRGLRRAARPLRLPLPTLRRQPRRISRRAFI